MACRDQIFTVAEAHSSELNQGDLKFDLLGYIHEIIIRMLHSLRKETFTPLDNESGFLFQMKEKVNNLKYRVCCIRIHSVMIKQNGRME